MTHGEAWYENKCRLQKAQKLDTHEVELIDIPPKMERKKAMRYYNTKLFAYWMDQLNDDISLLRKTQIISLFMFGHTDKYKLFKESKNDTLCKK